MRVLVAGGAGYIGSHTVRALLASGHAPVTLDNLSTGHRWAAAGDFVEGDLADRSLLDGLFREGRFDAVMHFCAHCYVGESVKEPAKYYRNNVANTLNLLEAMRGAAVPRFVFSSTCATYGAPAEVPISESCPQQPINPYGWSKLMVERLLRDFQAAYGLSFVALRYFNAAGAARDGSVGEDHDPETHLIPLVLMAALGRIPEVEVFGTDYPTPDGTCVRDYIHVEDLADAHVRALRHLERSPGAHFFNLGIGKGFSVKEVIAAAEKIAGRPVPRRFGPRREGDPPVLVAKADLARSALGWIPAYTSVEPILETAWRWHEKFFRADAKK